MRSTLIRAPQFTRPADTTAYAAVDLVANSTTAGSVVPLLFDLAPLNGRSTGKVAGCVLRKSTVTATLATFILQLFVNTSPTVTNGDNGALVVTAADIANYIGSVSLDLATGGSAIAGGPLVKLGSPAFGAITFSSRQKRLFGLLMANAAYVPASAETFDLALNIDY